MPSVGRMVSVTCLFYEVTTFDPAGGAAHAPPREGKFTEVVREIESLGGGGE